MVCFFHSSISVDMAKSVNSTDHRQVHKRTTPTSPNACRQSRSAIVDVIIMIAVVTACGFLVYPYVNILFFQTFEISGLIIGVMREEIIEAPVIYGCLGLSIFCAVIAVLTITLCSTSKKCGKLGCRGLHKAAEFDIQLETEDCVKDSSVLKKGLFELPRDHHRELEAELKKMAPPNGRAVLVFRARCGCSVGRMEVPGVKKARKVKK